MEEKPAITVTESDFQRLQKLMSLHGVHTALDEELARAHVVATKDAPPNLVTMNSRVVFEELTTRKRREVTLVYPDQADATAGRVSIFSPVGAALLGLTVGQEIDWELPQGRIGRFRIVDVTYQPEAAGDHHL